MHCERASNLINLNHAEDTGESHARAANQMASFTMGAPCNQGGVAEVSRTRKSAKATPLSSRHTGRSTLILTCSVGKKAYYRLPPRRPSTRLTLVSAQPQAKRFCTASSWHDECPFAGQNDAVTSGI